MSNVLIESILSPNNKNEDCTKFLIDTAPQNYVFSKAVLKGFAYTFSFFIRSVSSAKKLIINGETFSLTTAWQKINYAYRAGSDDLRLTFPSNGTYYVYGSSLNEKPVSATELKNALINGANRHICIKFLDGTLPDITEGIYSDSLSLERIINSGNTINLGECNSAIFNARIANIPDISNKDIMVYAEIDGFEQNVRLFTGKVLSCNKNHGTESRSITAYDAIKIHSDDDVTEWYNEAFNVRDKEEYKGQWLYSVIYNTDDVISYNDKYYIYRFKDIFEEEEDVITPESAKGKNPEQLLELYGKISYCPVRQLYNYNPYEYTNITLKNFRELLFEHVGIAQENTALKNDNEKLEYINVSKITFIDLIQSICQIEGANGIILPDGTFRYVFFGIGVSVSTTDYTGNCKYSLSDFEEKKHPVIDEVVFLLGEKTSARYGIGNNNPLVIKDNFILSSISTTKHDSIASRLYNIVKNGRYNEGKVTAIFSIFIEPGTSFSIKDNSGTTIKFKTAREILRGPQLIGQELYAVGKMPEEEKSISTNIFQKEQQEKDANAKIEEVKEDISAIQREKNEFVGKVSFFDGINKSKSVDVVFSKGKMKFTGADEYVFDSNTIFVDYSGTSRRGCASVSQDGRRCAAIGAVEDNRIGFIGQFGATGDTYSTRYVATTTSDIRLKKNILPSDVEALPAIEKMQLYSFDWKQSGKHQDIGFIADYLQGIDQNLVIDSTDTEPDSYKSVDDYYLLGYLVKAVQELSVELKEAKEEIEKLKRK